MNRYASEKAKYVFRPPKYSKFWAALVAPISNHYYRKRVHKVKGLKVGAGSEKLLELYRSGASILLTPNHSDHCDPNALVYLSRLYKMPLNFMAARETFQKIAGLSGFLLQRLGAFSVDREGADIQAIKQAMNILYDAEYPLVMFPEGEIYHTNEKLTPLNEGAATLAMRAARKISKEKPGQGVYIVPVALKYSYINDISDKFPERMSRLEERITWAPQDSLSIVERIYKFGEAVLALKEKECLGYTLGGDLDERLDKLQELLIAEQEEKYLGKVEEGDHPMRIRKVRGRIRSLLLDESKKPTPEEAKEYEDSLDRLYLAIQLYSYPGQYLREKVSMDRIAETILKFEEDILEESSIMGARSVEITFCEPIDLIAALGEYEGDQKGVISRITADIEGAISSKLV